MCRDTFLRAWGPGITAGHLARAQLGVCAEGMACPHKEPQKKWGITSLRESFLMKHTNLRNLHQKIKTPCFHLPVNLEAQKWKSLFLKPGEANKNLLQWELPDTDFMGRTRRTEEHLRSPPEASSEGSSERLGFRLSFRGTWGQGTCVLREL